jgi:glycosyltransferase involved in cell wall biosynthesis
VNDQTPLVVVPAFNEERSVGPVVGAIRAHGYPVCVIDDGSWDNTGEVARAEGANVLRLPFNIGVGGALRCGFRYATGAGYRVVVQVDGDGQHDPAQIPALLQKLWHTGADMVVGSRFLDPSAEYVVHAGRRLVMTLLARRASAAVGSRITDATSGFRAIREPLLTFFAREYPVEYLGDTFEALVSAGRCGARVVEHPIIATRRQHGSPSAGLVASAWYVVRVLAAASLVQSRIPTEPLERTASRIPPERLERTAS